MRRSIRPLTLCMAVALHIIGHDKLLLPEGCAEWTELVSASEYAGRTRKATHVKIIDIELPMLLDTTISNSSSRTFRGTWRQWEEEVRRCCRRMLRLLVPQSRTLEGF